MLHRRREGTNYNHDYGEREREKERGKKLTEQRNNIKQR